MNLLMYFEVPTLTKRFITRLTLEGLFPSVSSKMNLQSAWPEKACITICAFESSFT